MQMQKCTFTLKTFRNTDWPTLANIGGSIATAFNSSHSEAAAGFYSERGKRGDKNEDNFPQKQSLRNHFEQGHLPPSCEPTLLPENRIISFEVFIIFREMYEGKKMYVIIIRMCAKTGLNRLQGKRCTF